MNLRAAAAAVCLTCAAACSGAALAADGGSGTYAATGATYYFNLLNTGTAAWQFFIVIAPRGTTFVGGTTGNEQSARCIVGGPDESADEIECGPLSPSVVPVRAHIPFVATLSAPAACGAPFQLAVSSTGVAPFTSAPDVTEAGPCSVAVATAIAPPTLHGKPVVGRTLTATPPTWSAAPTSVVYRWQRCTATACTPIAGATRLSLALTRPDAGHGVRLVATAVVDGATIVSASKKLAVRAG